MPRLLRQGSESRTPHPRSRVLHLRPSQREHFWDALLKRHPALAGHPHGPGDVRHGRGMDLFREGSRKLQQSLHRARDLRWVRFLSASFSMRRRVEAAFVAATQLADAALEGETTRQLAERIAVMARRLSGAVGAAVHLRTAAGPQMLGSDGLVFASDSVRKCFESARVEWSGSAAAVPLRAHEQIVGALALQFDGGFRDLQALSPLLKRGGAVLAAAERESRKDRFLSLAAHELKTPLTSIKGFSYSLARRLEKGEPCDPRHVQVLERQAERLHALLEEMLEVSRIETARFTLHQEPCELLELVEASRRSLRRLGADADVEANVGAALPLVADRERIERALTAMVLRARALGPVRIDAGRNGGTAEVRVYWSGDPLPDAQEALLPRWELPQGQRQGLGMALMVARRAAELHGGTLRAEDHALILHLPLRARVPGRGTSSEGRVLVVDDDEPIARMMAEFLAEHGFEADWAGGGRSALLKIKSDPPDAMVLDLRMPDMDGRELLRAVRSLGFGPRVVLFSADREVAAAAAELSCEAFVEKPFAPESLLAAVRRALAPVLAGAK